MYLHHLLFAVSALAGQPWLESDPVLDDILMYVTLSFPGDLTHHPGTVLIDQDVEKFANPSIRQRRRRQAFTFTQATLIPNGFEFGDSRNWELVFDGKDLCPLQGIGPLMGADQVVRDYNANDYYNELALAYNTTRVGMVMANIGAARSNASATK